LEGLSLTAALAAAAAAMASCNNPPPARICVDNLGLRTADQGCAQTNWNGSHWRYYGGGQSIPALGALADGGSDTAQAGTAYRSAPDEGVSRGGFGGTAEDFGGEHGGE
jgi:hypothetical protein